MGRASQVFRVEIARVLAKNPVQGFTQRSLPVRNGNVMDVVVHQGIGPDANVIGKALAFAEFEVNAAIRVVEENIRLSIAAVRNVIGVTCDEVAKPSRHNPSDIQTELPGRNQRAAIAWVETQIPRNWKIKSVFE